MIAKLRKNQEPHFSQVKSLSSSLSITLLFLTTDFQKNNTKGIEETKPILFMLDRYQRGPKIISEAFTKLDQMKDCEERLVKQDEIINIFRHIDLPRYSQYLLMRSQDNLSEIENKFLEVLTSRSTKSSPSEIAYSNNLLDVKTSSPLEVEKQQSTEREIMDDKANSEKRYLRLEFNDITDPVEVGKTILKARQSAGLSQNQLVENSNKKVSLRTLSKLESGKAEHVPQITTLAEIAKATGMKLKVTLEK